jgi:hypothetical protein
VLAAKQQRKMKMHMAPDNKQHRKENPNVSRHGFCHKEWQPRQLCSHSPRVGENSVYKADKVMLLLDRSDINRFAKLK